VTPAAPRFSIVIPTHGRPRELSRCLESLTRLEPACGGSEVIVVDDSSPEPVDPIIARFTERLAVKLIVTPRGGPAMARNAGAAQAQGEILAFTDDDCEPSPGWLHALDECFRLDPNWLVGGHTLNAISNNIYSEGSQCLLDFVYQWQESKSDGSLRFFASNNFAVARSHFDSLGGFSPSFPFPAAEDRDFCARWIERGGKLRYAPDAQVLHSHRLSLLGFCRQHFTYGRGAWAFHATRAARGGEPRKLEPWGFY
jgi:GT2 family glycosyltransferase